MDGVLWMNLHIISIVQNSKNADKIYESLRELYGNEIANDKMFMKAVIDKVINKDEYRLLRTLII